MVNLQSSSALASIGGDATVRKLASGVRGEVLRPGDAGYDAARPVFNAMIDRSPALIVRGVGTGDVIRGVEFARTHRLPLAVRGGGNFGVVTSFTYRLHPLGKALAGAVTFPPAQARDALRFYHEFARTCPDELSTLGVLGRDADGRSVVSVAVCYSGSLAEGERVLHPLRAFGDPMADTVCPLDYCALQSASDAGFPRGRQHYWKSSFLRNLSDDAITVRLGMVAEMPSPFSFVGLQQMDGVAARVDPAATAFAHRARQYDFLILSQWVDPSETARNVTWTRQLFTAMEPYLERGVYSNNLGEEGEDRVRAAYGANYSRLAALKARYDPTNLFHHNQNVQPAERS